MREMRNFKWRGFFLLFLLFLFLGKSTEGTVAKEDSRNSEDSEVSKGLHEVKGKPVKGNQQQVGSNAHHKGNSREEICDKQLKYFL